MKTIRMFGYLMVAVCLCFGMASCSEDEGPDGAKGSAKLGNNSFSAPYGYWYVDTYSTNTSPSGKKPVQLEFYSFDPRSNKFPSSMHFVSFDFDIPVSADEIPSIVLKSGEYHVYVAYGMSMTSEGIQCETYDYDTEKPDLVIERNGSNYTVKVENLKVGDYSKEYNFSFNYSGKLKNEMISE